MYLETKTGQKIFHPYFEGSERVLKSRLENIEPSKQERISARYRSFLQYKKSQETMGGLYGCLAGGILTTALGYASQFFFPDCPPDPELIFFPAFLGATLSSLSLGFHLHDRFKHNQLRKRCLSDLSVEG